MIKVLKALYIGGYKIEIEFNDHTVKAVDFGNLIAKHPQPQHDKYRDIELFKQFNIEVGNHVSG